MISKDLATTVLGGVAAAITAASPVMSASTGSMQKNDWVQLAMAVIFAVFGFFTNKGSKSDQPDFGVKG